MDNLSSWKLWGEEGTEFKLIPIDGKIRGALQIDYQFGEKKGVWIQLENEYYLDLTKFNKLSFWVKGSGDRANLEIKLEDIDGSIFGKIYESLGMVKKWTKITVELDTLKYFWGGDQKMDWSVVKKIAFTVTKRKALKGEIAIDQIEIIPGEKKREIRVAPQKQFHTVKKDRMIALRSLKWVKSRQKKTGLITSYIGDHKPYAWTYDQAISLIMFAREDIKTAERIMKFYAKNQNKDGSWFDGYLAPTGEPGTDNKWIGSISWMTHAICDFINHGGDKKYLKSAEKAAQWILSKKRADGSYHDATEGNIDVWWALQATGHIKEADDLKEYLLRKRWDNELNRFYNGAGDKTIYLDLQTWGAEFAKGIKKPEMGLASLAFAEKTLKCKTFDGKTSGLDGGGPYTVWFEGTLQYIVAGGKNAQFYLDEVMKHQKKNGLIQHSVDSYDAGTVWHTTMPHVAPAIWIYFAHTESPLIPGVCKAVN